MFRSILVAVDGSAHSARALAEAVDIARGSGGRLTLMSVGVRPVVYPGVYTSTVTDVELERAALLVADKAAEDVPDGVPVSTVARVGRPSDEILKRARAAGHDLIVMGSRGHGAAASLILGSVSHAVLNQSPAAVLIVHAIEHAADA